MFKAEKVLADSGYYSEKGIEEVESSGVEAYVALGRGKHHKSIKDFYIFVSKSS